MPTFNQLVRKGREVVEKKYKAPALLRGWNSKKRIPVEQNSPQKRSVVYWLKPRLPKTELGLEKSRPRTLSSGLRLPRIPGRPHLQEHSVADTRRARQDLPGVRYHIVRGALDAQGVANRMQDAQIQRQKASHEQTNSHFQG